jgi:hypothetical protein
MNLFKLGISPLFLQLLMIPSAFIFAQESQSISDSEIKLVSSAELEHPKLASQALVQGIVVVRATLDDKGNVIETKALSGAEALIPACLGNARKWHFKPNPKKTVVIVYNFRVDATSSKPGCHHFAEEPPNFATITTCAPEIQ